jgi:hypothetical protein
MLPWLVTEGRQLLTVDGDALVLRGVNLSGPRPGVVPLAVPSDWPLNVVRLMVSAELDEAGMASLDAGITAWAEADAYTILVTPVRAFNDAPDAIDQFDITGLLALAERYADEPAVLFEPILPPVSAAGDAVENSFEREARRVRSVLAPLRAVHPRALCLAPAPADGLPLMSNGRPIPNLLYTLPLRSDSASPGLGQYIGSALLPRFVADWPLNLAHGLGDESLLCRFAAAGIGWAANAGEPDWLRMNRGSAEPTAAGRWLLRALTLAAAWDPAPARAA